jgi:transposase
MLPADAETPLEVVCIALAGNSVVLEAAGSAQFAACPACGTLSHTVHDRYRRQPRDLPWRGRSVRLVIRVRRFRCLAPGCARKTFAEPFGPALQRRARRTADADQLLLRFAWAAGGEGGARLARAAGLPASPDTLLRLLRRAEQAATATPRVLGVDDFALRRGRRYGTILIDLETHEPLDLLLERTADGLADWLRAHPGVEVVVRDRAEAYAEGARVGAPDAVQVADRFHLLQNASAALDELLRGRRRRLEYAPPGPPAEHADAAARPRAPPLNRTQQRQAAARARRQARWERVWELYQAGRSQRGIACDLGLARMTVKRYLDTPLPPAGSPPVEPGSGQPPVLSSPTLQPYAPYIQERWLAGCTNVSQLYRELVAQGSTASRSLLAQALQPWRPPRPPRPPQGARPRPRRLSVRWLCLRPPEQLDADEQTALQQLLAEDPELAAGHALLQRFRQVVANRDRGALEHWLADAQASHLPPFVSLVCGIERDRAAVDAALSMPWSNGPVEGHVHRVKLIKRQGYGRAKLDLLRRRVLAS